MNAHTPPKGSKPCPICRKPPDPGFRPFCSKRCADVDLNRWLVGVYAAPTQEPEEDEDEPVRRDPDAG